MTDIGEGGKLCHVARDGSHRRQSRETKAACVTQSRAGKLRLLDLREEGG